MPPRISSAIVFLALIPGMVLQAADCGSKPENGSERQLAFSKCLAATGRWDIAAEQASLYRQHHPDSIEGAVVDAQILMDTQHLREAADVLQGVLGLRPRSVLALTLYAEIARKLNNDLKAEELLKEATDLAPKDPEVWKRLGDFYLTKTPAKAAISFRRAVNLEPGDAQARVGLGAALGTSGLSAEATRQFVLAASINQKQLKPNGMVNLLYADYLSANSRFKESIVQYSRAIEEDHTLVDAYMGRGKAFIQLKQWENAERDLRRSAEDPRDEIPSLVLLTRAYRSEGKSDQLKESSDRLEKASASKDEMNTSGNRIAWQMLSASNLSREHKCGEAIPLYEQVMKQHPEVVDAYLQSSGCYAQLGRMNDADSTVRHFLSVESQSAQGEVLLGRILLKENQYESARQEFVRASRLDPLLIDAHMGMAACSITEQNYPEAIRVLREAQRIGLANNELRMMLAEAFYKNHQPEFAQSQLKIVLDSDPTNMTALQMKKSIEYTATK